MQFTEGRGIKGPIWYPHEIFRDDDANFINQIAYASVTDMLAILASQTTAAEAITGLLVLEDTGLDVDVSPGAAISFEGTYFVSDIWGFSASAGDIFSAIVAATQSITFDTGVGQGGLDRIDTVEIRPTQATWNTIPRNFKDPVTGIVTSASVPTRIEYVAEIQILKGTPGGSPVAPSKTSGWIKIAEVSVDDGQSAIVQADIADFRDSGSWTTEASDTIAKPQRNVGSGTSFPASPIFGDEFYRTDSDKWYKYNGATWVEI
jgi:hypothetical protein